VAETILDLGISHSVITSVTRDDLPDGGAGHFKSCIEAIRRLCPSTTVEVLIPDFQGNAEALQEVIGARPEVLNHNVETVPRLYPMVRPGAGFSRSLDILSVASRQAGMVVKSGLMVGMGEKDEEVMEVLGKLEKAGCQVVTIGQYLQPSRESLEVVRRVSDEQYARFADHGRTLGLQVVAGPLVRSSYRAREVMQGLLGEAL
jgi:lipoic acid synthetase